MDISIKNRSLRAAALAMMLTLAVAGCGGSGAGKGGVTASAAAVDEQNINISLFASSVTLPSDGSSPVDLTAVVTDSASGVALPGKTVSFVLNPAAGLRMDVTQGVTDASGVATASLHLNGDSTLRPFRVLASVDGRTPSELQMNVGTAATGGTANSSRGQLTVRLGTDNLIENMADLLSYRKRYVAIITDNAGIPKPGSSVLATLRPKTYYVGYWMAGWQQLRLNPAGQPSEDVADFGNCNAGEDYNRDGVLTPGNVASYSVSSQTDANGLAVVNIVYPKSNAMWVDMELEVTATVGGTEGRSSIVIPLPVMADDLININVPPPSISRRRDSMSGSGVPVANGGPAPAAGLDFPLQPAEISAGITMDSVVPGSPFPWLTVSPTCN